MMVIVRAQAFYASLQERLVLIANGRFRFIFFASGNCAVYGNNLTELRFKGAAHGVNIAGANFVYGLQQVRLQAREFKTRRPFLALHVRVATEQRNFAHTLKVTQANHLT